MFTQSKITLSADKYLGRGIMWHLEAALDLSTPSNSPRLVQFIWEEKLAVTLDASLIDIKFPVDYCTANNYRTHLESRKLNPNRWRNTRKKRARATSLHPREKMTIANQHGRVQSNLDSAIELMWRAPEVLNYQEIACDKIGWDVVVFFRRRVGDGACSFRFSAGHFGLDAPRWSILSADKSRRIITVLVELRPAMVLISLCHQEQTQKIMEGIVQLWDRMLPRWFWSTWLWNHCAIM
jgi:hypothetical protein